MEIFTKCAEEEGGIVRRDGWIDLPQQMGRVRLNSEYIADSETIMFMPGAKVPPTGVEADSVKPAATEEEVKDANGFEGSESDDEMSGSNSEVKTKE